MIVQKKNHRLFIDLGSFNFGKVANFAKVLKTSEV